MSESDEELEFNLDELPTDFGKQRSSPAETTGFPTIPGYEIKRLVGQGGMGAVYEGVREDGTHVAIKTIFVDRFQTIPLAARRRFDREIETLGELDHPNIVRLLDCGTFESELQAVPYFSMPFLELGDLAEVLAQSPIKNRSDLLRWVESLCGAVEGLAQAHTRGIVHRDIKPRNLFVSANEGLLLGDFGLTKTLQDDSELTSTIGHMGTTPYAPPEQLVSAKLADARADVYAMGVILHQLACFGVRPFAPHDSSDESSSETDSIARWQRSADRKVPIPSARSRHLSDASLDFIVRKCLAYSPDHRYPDANALLIDLRAWGRGEVVRGNLKERFRDVVLLPAQRHLLTIGFLAALLLALAGGLVSYQFSSLTDSVSGLEKDRQNRTAQRNRDLRRELEEILPTLKGEAKEFDIRRLSDPQLEFKKRNLRAHQIARELRLDSSRDLSDRHKYWVIRRTAERFDLSAAHVKNVRELVEFANTSVELARESQNVDEIKLAIEDLLRTQRLLLKVVWRIEESGRQEETKAWIDTEKSVFACETALAKLEDVEALQSVPSLRRQLDLLLFEIEIARLYHHPEQLCQACNARRNDFTKETLVRDGCREIHPWHIAWEIYERFYEAANELDGDEFDRQRIVDEWRELTVSSPYPSKDHFGLYGMWSIVVSDRQGDVLRNQGEFESAKKIYESAWQEIEDLRKFFRSEEVVWDVAEQVINSMIILAQDKKDNDERIRGLERQNALLRDKMDWISSADTTFGDLETRYELAMSLYRHAILVDGTVREGLLLESQSLAKDILDVSPEYKMTPRLLLEIEKLLTPETVSSVSQ